MPGKKIAFATTNYDETSGKPTSAPWDVVQYPEFNAMRSSKFNGLPVPAFVKLAFQEGDDKAKINYQEPGQPTPEANGTSKFIPVKILAGETMSLNVPRSSDVPCDGTLNISPITGQLIGNNNFFPVGPGTPWIEVDFEFLNLLFWRVKKWKASAPGSMDVASLDGGYISTNTPGTGNIDEEILISNSDPILASIVTPPGGEPGAPPAHVRRKIENFGEQIYEGIRGTARAEFTLSQIQVKNHIARKAPAHFSSCLKMIPEKNIIPGNDRYVLCVPSVGGTPTKYYINPTALYRLNCSYYKTDLRLMGVADCESLSSIRSAGISYDSSGQNFIKNSQSSSSLSCSEEACDRTTSSESLEWAKTLNDGYTLNIKVGNVTKTFTMPLSVGAWVNSISWIRDVSSCDPYNPPAPQFYTSIESFPRPSFVVNLEADEFWEYDDGQGNPIYNKITGEQLRDPITGQPS
jgi:hypothetical protein